MKLIISRREKSKDKSPLTARKDITQFAAVKSLSESVIFKYEDSFKLANDLCGEGIAPRDPPPGRLNSQLLDMRASTSALKASRS